MRDKIERLSRGEFEYEIPTLIISGHELVAFVEAGAQYKGSLQISNSTGRIMKGILYSTHRLLHIGSSSFHSSVYTVDYTLDASYLKAGDSISGEIIIISDCGERTVSLTAEVEAPFCETSLGKVKDLFQFANLARLDWIEAKKVFRSEDFERVVLQNDSKYKSVYQRLRQNASTSQGLEEFLIAIHKKNKIEIISDRETLEYEVSMDSFMDKLTLTKNQWGYAEIRVSTDAPFIKLEQKMLWSDKFIGNTYPLAFLVIPEEMRIGKNYGRIWIKTVYQTITIEVTCHRRQEEQKQRIQEVEQSQETDKKIWYGLTKNYLDFRMKRKKLSEYLSESGTLLEAMTGNERSYRKELVRIHIAQLSGQHKVADLLLEALAGEEAHLKRASAVEHSAYVYLNTLNRKEDAAISSGTEILRRYYQQGNSDWRILWFLLFTDQRYEKNRSIKLADIREQFDEGCHSPVLYYEAIMIYEEEPNLLQKLGEFEIQVFNYGVKNRLLSKEMSLQYTYLAGKLKHFRNIVFHCLTLLYEQYGDKDILFVICGILIKGLKKDHKYFTWYQMGVEQQLRITELCEYYMYSVKVTMTAPLPQHILLYFIYNSSLSERKRAFLYANIIRHKDKLGSIYRSYLKRMGTFVLKQLEIGKINADLAILYREFIYGTSISEEMTGLLHRVIFLNELTCENPNMIAVSVFYHETGEEKSQPLNQGKAHIQLYTENRDIFLVDAFGNRYGVSVVYNLKPLMFMEEREIESLNYRNSSMLLLHRFERDYIYRVRKAESVELWKELLRLPGLQEEYLTACLTMLIDYYHDNYNEEELEGYLSSINIYQVRQTEVIHFLEYYIIRRNYIKALELIKDFGFRQISMKRLLRMCSGWIAHYGVEVEEELMVELCYYIFQAGKYDEGILTYLIKHYHGSTDALYHLWEAARGFELNTHGLEERLLVQMLFSESHMRESFIVFDNYYKDVTNHILVRAYISYHGYRYLVHGLKPKKLLFPIMRRELNYEEDDISLLAWLKYNTGNQKLTASERDFISISIDRFIKKDIVLPFFPYYDEDIVLAERFEDRFILEYKAHPERQVYLHYRLMGKKGQGDYITEKMKNAFLGIHVKEIMLFYHERLQYYVTEESDGQIKTSDVFEILYEKEPAEEEKTKTALLNRILMAKEQQDDKRMLEIMEDYITLEYMGSECFKHISG